MAETSNERELRLLLDSSITRFCFRTDREGNTFLIEHGVKMGLIDYLVPKIIEIKLRKGGKQNG